MFIVTNRIVDESKHSEKDAFGDKPMAGPNELRLAEATRKGKKWQVDIPPDRITAPMARRSVPR